MTATMSGKTTDESVERVSMERNTAVVTPPRYGDRKGSPLVRLGVVWGCSPRVARDRMDRCFRDAADVVGAMMAEGQHDGLAAKMAPLDAALNAWAGPPALPEAVIASADADAGEDTAEARYHAEPSRTSALKWVRALARDCFHAERMMAALKLRWEL
jgi:hypothetical protein